MNIYLSTFMNIYIILVDIQKDLVLGTSFQTSKSSWMTSARNPLKAEAPLISCNQQQVCTCIYNIYIYI